MSDVDLNFYPFFSLMISHHSVCQLDISYDIIVNVVDMTLMLLGVTRHMWCNVT